MMAFIGVKTFKTIGSLFLFSLATLAVWKEIKMSQKMCEEASKLSSHVKGSNAVNTGDTLLPRRPARNGPAGSLDKFNSGENYIGDHLERSYTRIETSNITLLISSPPSSGITYLLELYYSLPIIRQSKVVPLINTTIISTGNYNQIKEYIHTALQEAQPPALLHTHAYHVEVPDSLRNRSVLLSVVRHPIERAVSLYNYARANNTKKDSEQVRKWRATLKIRKTESFEDCVRLRRTECVSEGATSRLIRHFCGYDKRCRKKTRWTLDRAKENIEKNYYAIGIRKDMNIFVQVIERRIPSIFNQGSRIFNNLLEKGKISRVDRYTKVMPSQETIKKIEAMMALDLELYEWINSRFEDAQREVGLKV